MKDFKSRLTDSLQLRALSWHLRSIASRIRPAVVLPLLSMLALAAYHASVQAPRARDLDGQKQRLAAALQQQQPAPQASPATQQLPAVPVSERHLALFGILRDAGLDVSEAVYGGKQNVSSLLVTASGTYPAFAQAYNALAQQDLVRIESASLLRHRAEDSILAITMLISLTGAAS